MFDREMLIETGRALASVDVGACADAELEAAVVGLASLRSAVEVAEAHVLAELDARGVPDRDHGMRTASWAAEVTGGARGPIVGRLKVGRALRASFDEIDVALGQGRVSFDHARQLCDLDNPRVTDVLAASQDSLIVLAESSTFAQWKRDLAALVAHADADGPEPDPYAGNELTLSRTLTGTSELRGSFDAANAAVLREALNAKTDELYRRFANDHEHSPEVDIPSRKVLRALALIELVGQAHTADPDTRSAPRAEFTMVLHDHEATDSNGIPLPRAAAQVWGCDPEVWAVIVDRMGVPVDVGHTKRLATAAQRRAIAVRDGGCTFPGCDAPITWCDHHHVTDWQNGGPTDLANLVALCRHHHTVTHRPDWKMTLDDHQIPHWITPRGDHLTGQRHHRTHPSPGTNTATGTGTDPPRQTSTRPSRPHPSSHPTPGPAPPSAA